MANDKKTDELKRAKQARRAARVRRGKLIFTGLAVTTVMAYLGSRVLYFKTVHGAEYEQAAIAQQYRASSAQTAIPAMRGGITDRNKQVLMDSIATYNLILDVRQLVSDKQKVGVTGADGSGAKDKDGKALTQTVMDDTLSKLNSICGITMDTLKGYAAIDPATHKPVNDTNYLIIARDIGADKANAIKNSGARHVFLEQGSKSGFPYDTLAAQVVGFVRGDSAFGLNEQYAAELSGTPGLLSRSYDANGQLQDRQTAPVNGYTLVSTIDVFLQQYAEQAVREAVDAYHPQNASAIIMNPRTGEVLAMAQAPGFDLNDPANPAKITGETFDTKAEASATADELNQLKLDALNNAWTNFNITRTFEPGSIYKPIVMAAALEEGAISLDDTFNCPGYYIVPGTTQRINCWQLSGHGKETLTNVLAHSCDVGMMQIGGKLGKDMYYKYQRDFGFGDFTGIDLPNETSANSPVLMPPLKRIGPVELATGSFGQGFNSTAIQDINAFAAIINGGNLMKPFVVSQIIDSNGSVVRDNKPQVERKVISKETSDFMRNAMVSVIQPSSRDATGFRGYIKGYSIGGKTGTAQQGIRALNQYALSFIAYLPADDPQIICMISINRPDQYTDGVTSPGYAMRDMLLNIIKYKGFRPDGPVSPKDGLVQAAGDITLDNYVGRPVGGAVSALNAAGMDYELIGGGDTVSAQIPMSGAQITQNTKVFLTLTNSGNSGIAPIPVPNVTGMDIDAATGAVKAAGLDVYAVKQQVVSPPADNVKSDTPAAQAAPPAPASAPPGSAPPSAPAPQSGVVCQVPDPGAQLPPGTQVKLIYR